MPGVEFAPDWGVWTEGAHGQWVRFAPGLTSPLHTHTHGYHGVVIAGTVVNPAAGEEVPVRLGPGAYWYMPGAAVYATGCVSEEPCLFYTHGDDLWDLQMEEQESGDEAVPEQPLVQTD